MDTKESLLAAPIIDFDTDAKHFNDLERLRFWQSNREWLLMHGYTLFKRFVYEQADEGLEKYIPVHPAEWPQPHPYAQSAGGNPEIMHSIFYQLGEEVKGRVVFAQDSMSRHVAIKIVKDGSDEYRILRFLSTDSSVLSSSEDFPCVMPVLDFLECGRHWFVVMPRWGSAASFPWFGNVREALKYMHSILRAVTFLHRNLIAHQDITPGNIAVNDIANNWFLRGNTMKADLRWRNLLTYALFDLDLSAMFSPDSTPAERRLPSQNWRVGNFDYLPYDTAQGEKDYDPFAFDIATLGSHLCEDFQHLTPIVPMLAPLLDNMVTWRISCRFTASEALEFFEKLYPELSAEQLDHPFLEPDHGDQPPWFGVWHNWDRWAGLPEDFIKKWEEFRDPPLPLKMRLFRRACKRPWAKNVVQRAKGFRSYDT